MSLHMLELYIDPERLIRFAQEHGVNKNRDQDLGYAMHAWLKSLLGEKAPKPFRLIQSRTCSPRVLGYSSADGETLLEQAHKFASPLATNVAIRVEDLRRAKPLPSEWDEGRRLGFEVLLCPVSRKRGKEKDLFLHRSEAWIESEPPLEREMVYREWMKERMSGAAELERADLSLFRLVSQYRQGSQGGGRRSASRLVRPQALFHGVLRIRNRNEFNALLARGIGRHRAFGYGMLLVRPA